MANIEKLQFPALKITGENYISWITDMELHLESEKLSDTIKDKNTSAAHEKAKSIIFMRRHLDENLMHDYAQIRDPTTLWNNLKERFDNQKTITLPHAMDEWASLRYQDFAKVKDYNSAMLRIVGNLRYCGKPVSDAEMIEKTYLTFHKNHYVLQEQYRNQGYKKFSDLMVALMLAEQNQELLIKNHEARPAGSKAIPEVNAADARHHEQKSHMTSGRGRRNRGRGRHNYSQARKPYTWVRPGENPKGKGIHKNTNTQRQESICYKCGSKGHYFRQCHTPAHLCALYKESMKGKGKEVNLAEHSEGTTDLEFEGTTPLDTSDFTMDLGDSIMNWDACENAN